MNKLLDLRFVIGVFFAILGVLLIIYSFSRAGGAETTNRWCGTIFLLFGIVMIALSYRKDANDELLPEEDR